MEGMLMRTAARARQDVFKDKRDAGCCKQLLQLQRASGRPQGQTRRRRFRTSFSGQTRRYIAITRTVATQIVC